MSAPASFERADYPDELAPCLEFGCDHRRNEHDGENGQCRTVTYDRRDGTKVECECKGFVE